MKDRDCRYAEVYFMSTVMRKSPGAQARIGVVDAVGEIPVSAHTRRIRPALSVFNLACQLVRGVIDSADCCALSQEM